MHAQMPLFKSCNQLASLILPFEQISDEKHIIIWNVKFQNAVGMGFT